MTTYTILFTNSHDVSGNFGHYCFFNQLPVVDGNTSDPRCFSNVWISKAVPSGGDVTITTSTSYFAWTGTAPRAIAEGVTVSSGKGLLATLGTSQAPGSTFMLKNDDGTPDIVYEGMTANKGSFEIDTGTDFRYDDNFLIGLGLLDDHGIVVPSAVIPADQNSDTNIMPIVKFYVAKMDATQGTVIDFQSVSRVSALIDFSDPANQGKQFAHVTHLADGTWSVTYADQPMFARTLAKRGKGLDTGALTRRDVSEFHSKISRLEQLFTALLEKGGPLEQAVGSQAVGAQAVGAQGVGAQAGGPRPLYCATVGWLHSMSPQAMREGSKIIWNYLFSRGYRGTWNLDGSRFMTTVTINHVPRPVPEGLMPGAVPAYIVTDWTNAVAADAKDKPIDMGIVPAAALTKTLSDLKHEAREYMQNQGLVSNNV